MEFDGGDRRRAGYLSVMSPCWKEKWLKGWTWRELYLLVFCDGHFERDDSEFLGWLKCYVELNSGDVYCELILRREVGNAKTLEASVLIGQFESNNLESPATPDIHDKFLGSNGLESREE